MTYGNFQRLDEARAYSKMRKEQIESEAQERKEILDKCEEASKKIDERDENGREELFQALIEFNDLRDEQEERKRR